jgi:hypothetical protein
VGTQGYPCLTGTSLSIFDITCPRPKTVVPVGQFQGSMLKRNSAGFKVDHLDGVSITHWSKEGEPGLSLTGNVRWDLSS